MAWSVRLRSSTGQATLSGLAPNTSLQTLQALIEQQTGVPVDAQELLAGFPPKLLQAGGDAGGSTSLASIGITNGDSLTVRAKAAPAQPQTPAPAPAAEPARPTPAAAAAAAADTAPEAAFTAASVGLAASNGAYAGLDDDEDAQLAAAIAASLQDSQQPSGPTSSSAPRNGSSKQQPGSGQTPAGKGPTPTAVVLSDGCAVTRRVIPSDNSCLFTAVGYTMEHDRTRASALRRVIADAVAGDPVTYNEGFLGQENEDYQKWILDSKHWGGAIELSILSAHYGREIAAYDIQTKRVDVYGEGAGHSERVMLLYDGLHYDALAVAAFEGAPEELDITVLAVGSAEAAAAASGAEALVAACHDARQFTDIANFTLRCGVCLIGLKGEKEAVEHAKATGHQNFSEY